MKTLPATNPQAATLYLSPVAVWQMLLKRLLEQHYSLMLNDTSFSDDPLYRNMLMLVLVSDAFQLVHISKVCRPSA